VLAPRVKGHGATKDLKAVVDDREVVILLPAIALIILGPLAGVTLPLGTPEEVAFHHAILLEVCLIGPQWYRHGLSSISSKTPGPP
jgi:hypothetical protein